MEKYLWWKEIKYNNNKVEVKILDSQSGFDIGYIGDQIGLWLCTQACH